MGRAEHLGWKIGWAPDRPVVQLTDPRSGPATFGFDERGRVNNISGDLKAAGQR